jgi:hypothetical protein
VTTRISTDPLMSDQDHWPPPAAQILGEVLERLRARGVLTLHRSLLDAAAALDDELRSVDPFYDRQSQAAAILALRAAGWPPSEISTLEERSAFAQAAWNVQHLLATDDPRHVADLLRHAESAFGTGSVRSVEALTPIAARAITEYRRLIDATKSPNGR